MKIVSPSQTYRILWCLGGVHSLTRGRSHLPPLPSPIVTVLACSSLNLPGMVLSQGFCTGRSFHPSTILEWLFPHKSAQLTPSPLLSKSHLLSDSPHTLFKTTTPSLPFPLTHHEHAPMLICSISVITIYFTYFFPIRL